MIYYESRVGKKFQTVVPMQVREAAHVEEGDCLLWELQEDGSIVVRPQKSKTDFLMHLNHKVWGSYKVAEEHRQKEKAGWDQ